MAITDPTDLTSLQAWYDAIGGTTITEDANGVTDWTDGESNSYDLAQGTNSRKPDFGAINGNDGIQCDGSSGHHVDNTSISPVISSTGMTIAMVVTTEDIVATNDRPLVLGSAANSRELTFEKDAADFKLAAQNNAFELTSSNALVNNQTQWFIARIRPTADGASDILGDDASDDSANSGITLNDIDDISVGAANNGANSWIGYIHEVVICDTFLSDLERTDLADYFDQKWLGSGGTITGAHALPAPTQSAAAKVIGKASAAHALPAPTQAAAVAVVAKATASHSLPAPTQSATVGAIAKVAAAHALPAPTQAAGVAAITEVTAAHALPAPTQTAVLSASDVGTVTADHSLPAPTQSATVGVIAKAAAAHALPAPTQTALAKAIAKTAAAHSLPAPTQTAVVSAAITRSITATHVLPAPTQAAAARVIAKANGIHTLPAPTQSASLDVIEVPEITAAHRLPAPTMSASLAVISRVAANHALPAPSQSAFVRTGERQAIALVGSLPGSINLQGAKPAISLTGEINQRGIALGGSIPT